MNKKMKSFIVILLVVAFCLSLTGCGENAGNDPQGSEGYSESTGTIDEKVIKIKDYAGREVEIKQYAERIVDLTYLDGVRTLVELGAQDTLVGMSDMDHDIFEWENGGNSYVIVPKAAPELKNVTNVGSYKEPNAQLVMSLQPDVIFMQKDMKELADTLQKQTNIPVVCIGGDGSLDFEILRLAGKIVGKEERAEELIAFCQKKIKKVTDITDNIPEEEKHRVFFWARPFIGDPRTNADYEPLEMAGAKNVAADAAIKPHESYKITKEQIAAWNPEIIFKHTGMKDSEGWHTIESILNDPVIQGVQAIKEKKVYPTKGFMRGWDPATGVTEVLYLAKIMYPDKFASLNVEKEGNETLKKFYGVDGVYTEMVDFLNLYKWE